MNGLTEEQIKLRESILAKPLFAHISTIHNDEPRESPVWYLWEENQLWIIGNYKTDSFPKRIERNSKCAIGIVDFDVSEGIVRHVGFRGNAYLEKANNKIIERLFFKYLGEYKKWHPRFQSVLDNKDYVLIKFEYNTIVVRDQSY